MNTASLYPLIDDSIRNYDRAVTYFPDYFINLDHVCPIVWFGELNSEFPKVITFGSNPSDKEFLNNSHVLLARPRFYNFFNRPLSVTASSITPPGGLAQNIEEDDNEYFRTNPYHWFKSIHNLVRKCYPFDPSIIHIDALPFATSVKFTALDRSVQATCPNPYFNTFADVLAWGANFAERLLTEIVDNDDVRGIMIVGGESIRQFKIIFNASIRNVRTAPYMAKDKKYSIEKFDLHLAGKTIEVVGTTIYLPNSHLGNHLNVTHLATSLQQL